MNISEHISVFIQEMKRRKFGQQTIDNYASCIKKFFESSPKDHPKSINEQDIKEFLGKFDEPNTQRAHHSAIKKFYEICLNQKNKFKYIPYCKKSKKLPIILSVQEIQAMFSVCENLKHSVILALLYSCGLRVSELINLKWADIDRSRKVINIIQAKGKKDRQVPLNEKIIPLLENYWRQYKSKEYVLNGQNLPQYSKRSVGEVIKQLASKSGIKKHVKTHLIRHCYATHCIEDGMDINFLQKLLGHSDVKTTMIYAHISNNLISKASSPINQIDFKVS
jgi:site-specific recombinase XerD